jgi:hypothetical protein
MVARRSDRAGVANYSSRDVPGQESPFLPISTFPKLGCPLQTLRHQATRARWASRFSWDEGRRVSSPLIYASAEAAKSSVRRGDEA